MVAEAAVAKKSQKTEYPGGYDPLGGFGVFVVDLLRTYLNVLSAQGVENDLSRETG